ncbi:MAG TPA: hypothetical protein VNC84_01655 [Gammaproteobacteria bacterium]|nr:hypothetical protein [Gammaproteobacteria bacterium]
MVTVLRLVFIATVWMVLSACASTTGMDGQPMDTPRAGGDYAPAGPASMYRSPTPAAPAAIRAAAGR